MYTMQEVSEIFKVTEKTIMNWVKAGRVKAVKIGGVTRITQEELDRITSVQKEV